jgi:DNA-binding MarR family transcriptional regulator
MSASGGKGPVRGRAEQRSHCRIADPSQTRRDAGGRICFYSILFQMKLKYRLMTNDASTTPGNSASVDCDGACVTGDGDSLHLRDFLPYRLSVLSNLVSGLIADEYSARFDLTIAQWRIMAVLAEYAALTARDIEPIVRMDKVAISRAVRSLTERRLLRRRASQEDGRLAYLSLTVAGRRVYEQVRPIALRHERELLAVLTPAEARTLSSLLAKLDAQAVAMRARPGPE